VRPAGRRAPGPRPGAAGLAPPEHAFVPSQHALRFANGFPSAPALSWSLGAVQVGVGDVADGVCGGMVFAALDHWRAGLPPPSDPAPPAPGSPLYRYLVRRLIDSWDLPVGPLVYLGLMSPLLGDGDRVVGPLSLRGRSRRTRDEWSRIRAVLDQGHPCPLGLVKVRSADPRLLGRNHQVLAYGYEAASGRARLAVYDPNQGADDDVTLDIDLEASPVVAQLVPEVSAEREVFALFAVRYRWKSPPAR